MEGAHHLILYFIIICYYRDVCATNIENKIIGGKKINIKERPYQAIIMIEGPDGTHEPCGGSIIGDGRFILTSASCLYEDLEGYVLAGITNINEALDDEKAWHPVKTTYLHPKYKRTSYEYDVGIVELSEPLPLNGVTMKAIELVDITTDVPEDTKVTIGGWGKITDSNGWDLKMVTSSVVADDECRSTYGEQYNEDMMFCATGQDGSTDNCSGDFGGPVTLVDAKIQVGVFTIGYDCRGTDKPAVFAKLSNADIANWIQETLESK